MNEVVKISMKDVMHIELDGIKYYVQVDRISMLSTPIGRKISVTLTGREG